MKQHGNKGRKQTEEHRRKIGEANKIRKGYKPNQNQLDALKLGRYKGKKHTEESKIKIGLAGKGRLQSNETKKKHSIGAKKGGCGKWMKGRKLSEETCKKLSNIKQGSNHPNWKGGKIDYQKKQVPRPKPEICEVCGTFAGTGKAGIHYDHDHATGKFRGWLCARCNVALGMVKDNAETLRALATYLENSRIGN